MSTDSQKRLAKALLQTIGERSVAIVGLGREGLASYAFLRKNAPELPILISDQKMASELDSSAQQILSDDPLTTFQSADEFSKQFSQEQQWLIVKSPGVPAENPVVQAALTQHNQITSNTELLLQLLPNLAPQAKVIGITGTKGKSTTTSLIYHLLTVAKLPSLLTGNIGTPPLRTLQEIIELSTAEQEALRFVVFELSSHQLRELHVSPQIAVILNITPEHLDYYVDFASYHEAKAPICSYQAAEDWVIFNPEFAAAAELAARSPGKKLLVSLEPKPGTEYAASRKNDLLYSGKFPVIPIADVPLVGEHNLLNVLPALAIGGALELNPTVMAGAIHSFQALPHRLALVAEQGGVKYYNDSQATNPEAAIAALSSFPQQRIHLIAGGSDKGLDLESFGKAIAESGVVTLVLFAPMGEKIEQFVRKYQKVNQDINIISSESMKDAVAQIQSHVQSDDVVLLAPACASFGMFKNYQDRGEQFVKAVLSQ